MTVRSHEVRDHQLFVAFASRLRPTPKLTPAKNIAAALQPFVENHTIAGAVTLVADKDKVLSLDTVGYADLAAKKPMRVGQSLLDRLDDQAGDGNGRADAPG